MFELVGLLVAFVIIIAFRAKNIDFTLSILSASAVIGLTSQRPLESLINVTLTTAADYSTWELCAAVALITILGNALKETGIMVRFIEQLRRFISGRVLLALIPAIFGSLTMPGGALMSAPFVEPEANRLGLRPEHRTYLNVWFRHVLYWSNPIASTTILITSLSGIDMRTFLVTQAPVFLAMVSIGFIVGRNFPKKDGSSAAETPNANGYALMGGLPFVVTVALSLFGVPVWAALVVGIVFTFILSRSSLRNAAGAVRRGFQPGIMASAFAMMFFRQMISYTGSMTGLFSGFMSQGFPLIALVIIIPLLLGVISGTPPMGIGIAFPVLLPLLGGPNVYLMSVVFVGIVCSYLASPLHLCLVMTNEYFRSDIRKVYRFLIPSAAALYVFAVAYNLLMNMV